MVKKFRKVFDVTKEELIKEFDCLQDIYGSKNRNSVYGGGCEKNPELCLVFINPTARNIATDKAWKGIRRQWLGTKNIWSFLTQAGLFDERLNSRIQSMKPADWTEAFCEEVYDEVEKRKIYITNLAKCTQDDARGLPDAVFRNYRDLFFEEMKLIYPKKIVLFGNQVASIVLDKKISVSQWRKKLETFCFDGKEFWCLPVFYPVGNGRFNAPKAIEDLIWIKNQK